MGFGSFLKGAIAPLNPFNNNGILGGSVAGTGSNILGGNGSITNNILSTIKGQTAYQNATTQEQQNMLTKASVFQALSPEQQKDFLINNPDIITPFGSQQYDPLTNTITLNESGFQEGQRLKSEDLSTALLNSVNGTLPSTDGQTVARAEFDRNMSLLEPEMDTQKRQLQQQLADQGIPIGSEAYQRAMNRMERSQGEQMQRLSQASVSQGIQTAEAQRQARFNEISALLGQAQVGPASFNSYQPQKSTLDLLGAEQAGLNRQTQQNIANQQASAQKKAALYGALGSLGSAGIGAAFSDIRLKTNISKIGTSPSEIDIYTFRYIEGKSLPKGKFQGVIAQQLIGKHPESLSKDGDYYKVDYSKIDVEFKKLENE